MLEQLLKYKDYDLFINDSDDYKARFNHDKKQINIINKNRYKIESTYLEHPLFIETESNEEAYEMFVAYCDYQGIDEDDIECKQNDIGIIYAEAKQYGEDTEEDESIAKFTFEMIK